MTCLEFFNIRSHSTGDIASTGNSNDDPLSSCVQEPTYKLCPQDEPEKACDSDDDSEDSFIIPYMKKSHSLNIIHDSDKPATDKCQVLNAYITVNDSNEPIDMRMRIRVLEAGKRAYIYNAVKLFNKDLRFIETVPNINNITSKSVIMRGFETLRDSRWLYFQYIDNQIRCTLKPSLHNVESLKFNALTSPFVSINFSDVTAYNGMFSSMPNLKEIVIEKFDMSRVTSMKEMFINCTSLETITFINCDLSSVETMYKMCYGCTKLKEIKFIKCKLNSACSYWDMFGNCPSLETISVPLYVYQLIIQETRSLSSKFLIWHGA